MIRTQVGYTGGTKANPTYRSLGDHSEAIQIEYDQTQISYAELLDLFWNSHNPSAKSWTRQYASIIFYHDEEQKRLALESRDREAANRESPLFTEIRPIEQFYAAEAYHQKYYLRQVPELWALLQGIYPDSNDLRTLYPALHSTAAARINGYMGGHGTLASIREALSELDLPSETTQQILEILSTIGR